MPSTGEARRQVQSGGLRVNDQPVTDARQVLNEADAVNDGAVKLSFGKKKHVLLRVTGRAPLLPWEKLSCRA